jgi:hypothetical protein
MMSDRYEFNRLNALLDGNGEQVRRQFILAGLLLTIFERFKKYVVGQVDSFFSNQFTFENDDIVYVRGEKFKELVKQKGKGEPGQHSNKDFRAALHWFCDLDAISKDELEEIERIYVLRNAIGHELFEIIADDRKAPLTLWDILTTFAVYVKIVRWWVKEVEMTTDPDFDQDQYDSTDFDGIESADTLFLRSVIRKALSNDDEWKELEKPLQK